MKILFNSKESCYKKPFGAVKNDENIYFSILFEDGVYINSVKIVFEKKEIFLCEKYLSYSGFYDGYHKFECNIAFCDTGIYYYYFVADTENGEIIGRCNHGQFSENPGLPLWQLTVYDKNFKTPDWAKGKIMYQIFPDRFKRDNSYTIPKTKNKRTIHENWNDIPEFIYDVSEYTANDFFCGNIKGIISMLDYIKELGVGIIYLNPVFESSTNHRYATADYTNIDPYLGTNEDFKNLCKEAEKRDISIILDGVFSHTGDDSIYFNKYKNYDSLGAYESDDSPYRSWYKFSEKKDKYACWWGFTTLPEVCEENPDFMNFITDEKNGVIKLWNDCGVKGWRLDVADELPDVFIDKFRSSLKNINKDSLLIGEVWEDATTKESYNIKRRYLLGNQLDSVMNYPFKNAILNFACGGKGTDFLNTVTNILENYPAPAIDVLMNFISTHDTIRAITALNFRRTVEARKQGSFKMNEEEYNEAKKRLFLSVFLQFSLPGIPCIYYGDEVGMEGYKDPYNRTTYPYGKEDFEILNFHKKTANIKNKYAEDFSKPLKAIFADDTTVCFERGGLLFVINNSECKFVKLKNIKEKIFGDGEIVFNSYGILMPPCSFGIFKRKEDKNNG